MTYLTFKPIPGGYGIWFVNNKVGVLSREADGDHYLLYAGKEGSILPDYILREIVEKMEELNEK